MTKQAYASILVVAPSNLAQAPKTNIKSGPTPIEIDVAHHLGPLLEVENQQCQANNLCLYCGGLGT